MRIESAAALSSLLAFIFASSRPRCIPDQIAYQKAAMVATAETKIVIRLVMAGP